MSGRAAGDRPDDSVDVGGHGSTRRQVLAAGGGLTALVLAGCADDEGAPAGTDGPDGTDGGGTTGKNGKHGTTETASSTDTGTGRTTDDGTGGSRGDGELDLREANVTAVEVEPADGREFRFSVTLLHDDDGEDGYANWWQVERLDGDRLGRRDLAHAHGTREFTRSETVTVPEGTSCVVVRGHDQTHGYGGRAAIVDVDSGATRPVDQGRVPETFTPEDCP